MLFVGYFEGIDSQRGIAWRCGDSLSLRQFLGYTLKEATPDHSSLTRVRDRLSLEVHEQVFACVLAVAEKHRLLVGRTALVDSTTLEANAAMKSIVRKDTGEDWQAYLKRLMQEAGVIGEDDEPTEEELRRFDKNRKDKKASNKEWGSRTDPDSRITKMKDGRTHLAYKAEHVVDADSDLLLAATVYQADQADTETLLESLLIAQVFLIISQQEPKRIEDAVADKGYHSNQVLADCAACHVRTYLPEPKRKKHRWTDKPAAWQVNYRNNRRRVEGERGRQLSRQRSEMIERSFAHVCETGGARRTWLRGLEKINKRYQIQTAARNLGVMMRRLFGIGKPRVLQGGPAADLAACFSCWTAFVASCSPSLLLKRREHHRSSFAKTPHIVLSI
ncbi:Transposase DDE domain protein [Blastopirellula retiformator]|uniref:Transposase DDE domain protein n=2 Tax=Blastopirellula retiformator TaxID=2527970 RepID=A0A5C5VM34_9BACT|nr:Transposase DDE domain protein [Blastopirellula retiformator]